MTLGRSELGKEGTAPGRRTCSEYAAWPRGAASSPTPSSPRFSLGERATEAGVLEGAASSGAADREPGLAVDDGATDAGDRQPSLPAGAGDPRIAVANHPRLVRLVAAADPARAPVVIVLVPVRRTPTGEKDRIACARLRHAVEHGADLHLVRVRPDASCDEVSKLGVEDGEVEAVIVIETRLLEADDLGVDDVRQAVGVAGRGTERLRGHDLLRTSS